MQNECAEIKLRAERRAGELLAGMEKQKPGKYQRRPDNATRLSADPTVCYHPLFLFDDGPGFIKRQERPSASSTRLAPTFVRQNHCVPAAGEHRITLAGGRNRLCVQRAVTR